jgi:hypothetical protein
MPRGLNRTGDYRNGTPITLPHEFGTPMDLTTHNFGNPVTLPKNFGNPITLPHEFGNVITPAVTFSLSGISPSGGAVNAQTPFTLSGSGFLNLGNFDVVLDGVVAANWSVADDNTITGTSEVGVTPGTGNVQVIDADLGTQTLTNAWTYTAAPSAFTFLTSGSIDSTGTNPITLDTTGATFLAAVIAQSGAPPVLVDGNNNTWNYLTIRTANGVQTRIAYAFAPVVGAGHTFSIGGSCVGFVYAFGGATTTAACFLNENGSVAATANPVPGSVTPATGGVVLTGIVGVVNDTSSATVNDSFTGLLKRFTNIQGAAAYLLTADATPVSPTWTQGSGSTAAVIAAFQPA